MFLDLFPINHAARNGRNPSVQKEDTMQGISLAYLMACVRALWGANSNLLNTAVRRTVTTVSYGKEDTLALDAIAEEEIAESLTRFDHSATLVTEEAGKLASGDGNHQHGAQFFSDPVDGSKQLQQFLMRSKFDPQARVADLIYASSAVADWEKMHGAPASVTGACSAITMVRDGVPVFAAILNFISQELVVACRDGIVRISLPHIKDGLPEPLTPAWLFGNGTPLSFDWAPAQEKDWSRPFVTYLPNDETYRSNFQGCRIFGDDEKRVASLVGKSTTGPARPLYLSDLHRQPRVKFVAANGEKIGEWIHWLPFIRFAKRGDEPLLRLYEVVPERPVVKGGILMSPPPEYSIFQQVAHGVFLINCRRLRAFPNPSLFRSTLVLLPSDNVHIRSIMKSNRHRRIQLPS